MVQILGFSGNSTDRPRASTVEVLSVVGPIADSGTLEAVPAQHVSPVRVGLTSQLIPIVKREPVSIVRRAPPTVSPSFLFQPKANKAVFFFVSFHQGVTQSGILFLVSIERGTSRRVYHHRPWLSDMSQLGGAPCRFLARLAVARVGVVGPTRIRHYLPLDQANSSPNQPPALGQSIASDPRSGKTISKALHSTERLRKVSGDCGNFSGKIIKGTPASGRFSTR